MTDEPTNGELGRLIEGVRRDMREGQSAIQTTLMQLVPRELYERDRADITGRIAGVESAREADAVKARGTRMWLAGLAVAVVIALFPYAAPLVTSEA